jgi:glyoxylase-like metal-dependent hydrolase (beta-lactamase superfamily II)
MLGDIVAIAERTLMIEGLDPSLILIEPDVASVLLHRSGETLYILDTGATLQVRKRIVEAAEQLRPFQRLVILNSHGHTDHTANNGVLRDIAAQTKEHFISEAGLPLLDYHRHFAAMFKTISALYFIEDGPDFPWSLLFRPFKLLRYTRPELIENRIVPAIVDRVLSKMAPLDPSVSTATPFERQAPRPLSIPGGPSRGWNFTDDVYVIESRGHTPDSMCFYLPKVKLLFMGDETVPYFNIFPNSCAARVAASLRSARSMAAAGAVDVLIGGHQQKPFRGSQITELLDQLLSDHEVFRREVFASVGKHPMGATMIQIYDDLQKRRSIPAVDRYFRFEFPKMPPFLKTQIACLLLEEGYAAVGPAGLKRFVPPIKLAEGARRPWTNTVDETKRSASITR